VVKGENTDKHSGCMLKGCNLQNGGAAPERSSPRRALAPSRRTHARRGNAKADAARARTCARPPAENARVLEGMMMMLVWFAGNVLGGEGGTAKRDLFLK
jgi:hypothetical protein